MRCGAIPWAFADGVLAGGGRASSWISDCARPRVKSRRPAARESHGDRLTGPIRGRDDAAAKRAATEWAELYNRSSCAPSTAWALAPPFRCSAVLKLDEGAAVSCRGGREHRLEQLPLEAQALRESEPPKARLVSLVIIAALSDVGDVRRRHHRASTKPSAGRIRATRSSGSASTAFIRSGQADPSSSPWPLLSARVRRWCRWRRASRRRA